MLAAQRPPASMLPDTNHEASSDHIEGRECALGKQIPRHMWMIYVCINTCMYTCVCMYVCVCMRMCVCVVCHEESNRAARAYASDVCVPYASDVCVPPRCRPGTWWPADSLLKARAEL